MIHNNDGSFTLEKLFWTTEPKTDKFRGHNYGLYYFPEFEGKDNIRLLEIGIKYGESLNLWSKYFKNGLVEAVDIENKFGNLLNGANNVSVYIKNAYTEDFVNNLEGLYDYIIEDGSHHPNDQKKATDLYYSKLKTGGKLIIEDIQGKGYLKLLEDYCKSKNLNYKVFDFTEIDGKIDDILIEITKV